MSRRLWCSLFLLLGMLSLVFVSCLVVALIWLLAGDFLADGSVHVSAQSWPLSGVLPVAQWRMSFVLGGFRAWCFFPSLVFLPCCLMLLSSDWLPPWFAGKVSARLFVIFCSVLAACVR